jgi:hypothetical protein
MKSAAYLKKVLTGYEEVGLLPGDPDYEWNDAHHPTPKCEGGTETVPLVEGNHFIHDLYQSEDWGRCCFFPSDVQTHLYGQGFLCENWFDLVALYEKWSSWQGLMAGKKVVEMGVGAHAPENLGKGGRKTLEMGVGVHAPGVSSMAGKIGAKTTNAQKWGCLVTGFVSNPGPLTNHQQARGISTLLRTKLDGTDLTSQTMLLGLAMA